MRSPALALVLLPACVSRADLELSTVTEGMRTVFFAVGEPPSFYAFDPTKTREPLMLTLRPGTRIEAIAYPFTAEELQLPALGWIDSAVEGRPLPSASRRIKEIEIGAGPWRDRSEPSLAVQVFSIPAFDGDACATKGGCVRADIRDICFAPCPPPSPILDPELPALPEAPAPVVLAPCPVGWRTVQDEIVWCDRATPPALACADFEAQYARTASSSCTRIGPACPASGWPDISAALAPIYVHPAAAPGGDGSRDRPLASIAGALALGALDRPIALAAATFRENVSIERRAKIIGACTELTLIEAGGAAVIEVIDAEAEISDLRVHAYDGTKGVSARGPASSLSIHGVSILGDGNGHGLEVISGTITARDVVVRGFSHSGMLAREGGRLDVERGVVERVDQYGVLFSGSASGTLIDLAVRDMRSERVPIINGLAIAERSNVELSGLTIERIPGWGVQVSSAQAILRDTIISGLRGGAGFGVVLAGDTAAELHELTIRGARQVGFYLDGAAVTATISDVLIADTSTTADGIGGAGLIVHAGSLHADRVRVSRAALRGIANDQGRFTGSNISIADIQPAACSPADPNPVCAGNGLSNWTAHTELRGLSIENVLTYGIENLEGSAVLEDVTVDRVGRQRVAGGIAVALFTNGTTTISRARFERSDQRGVWVSAPGSLVGTDVEVRDNAIDGDGIHGIFLLQGDTELTRARGTRSFGTCVYAADADTVVTIRDLTCEALEKAEAPDGNAYPGSGISVVNDARATIEGVLINGVWGPGISVEEAGQLDAKDVMVFDASGGGVIVHGGRASFERARVERCHGDGLYVRNQLSLPVFEAVLDATHIVLSGMRTRLVDFADETSSSVRIDQASRMRVEHFRILDGEATTGLYQGGRLELIDGLVKGNAGPFLVPDTKFDLSGLMIGVTYEPGPGKPVFVR